MKKFILYLCLIIVIVGGVLFYNHSNENKKEMSVNQEEHHLFHERIKSFVENTHLSRVIIEQQFSKDKDFIKSELDQIEKKEPNIWKEKASKAFKSMKKNTSWTKDEILNELENTELFNKNDLPK